MADSGSQINTITTSGGNSYSRQQRSGYNASSQILGTKVLLVRQKFSGSEFDSWLALLRHGLAVEKFKELIALDPKARPDIDVILANDIPFFRMDLMVLLQEKKVLDKNGFLIGFSNAIKEQFDENDFAFLPDKLAAVNFGLKNKDLEEDLRRELYRVIIYEHQLQEVTQEETTRYQSRKEGFFENILDQFAGSAVGSVVYPDKIHKTKQKVLYVPFLDVMAYFPEIVWGFANYPFENPNKGLVILNGDHNLTQLDASYQSKDGITHYEVGLRRRIIFNRDRRNENHIPFGELFANYNRVYDASSSTHFASLGIGGGAAGKHYIYDFVIGPTLKLNSGDSALGFYAQLGGSYFPFQPLSIDMSYANFSQPNLFANPAQTLWSLSQFKIGLGAHVAFVSITGGYQWLSAPNAIVNQGYYFGLQGYF